jgi:hypothetical protein
VVLGVHPADEREAEQCDHGAKHCPGDSSHGNLLGREPPECRPLAEDGREIALREV